MEFIINPDAKFIVDEYGSFSIKNIKVLPWKDNFDYGSDDELAKITNGCG